MNRPLPPTAPGRILTNSHKAPRLHLIFLQRARPDFWKSLSRPRTASQGIGRPCYGDRLRWKR